MTQLLRMTLAALLIGFAALPLRAEDAGYEALLAQLANAETQEGANALTAKIWDIWLTAPDETAQEVLDKAMRRREAYDFLGALDHLNRLVDGWPDYAEGWNQRATLHFLRGDFEASLADVAETLAREPRHFGALSGKAVIFYQQGKIPLAQIAVREALKHHPFLAERAILNATPGTDL